MMRLDLFANRISKVLFVGGVVRIEFCVLQPDEKGEVTRDTPVRPEDVHFTVTLPLQGYSRSTAELRRFTQDLQQKGILKQQEQGPEQQGGEEGSEGGEGQQGGRGPRGRGQGGPQGGRGPGGRGQGGPRGQGGRAGPAQRQRELTDLTADSGEEPLV